MSAQVVGGRYRLESRLGRGGMAVVWRCVDLRLGRPVAVKVLDAAAGMDPTWTQRFDREARVVAGLAHPNIVAVYDAGTDDGMPYLVMELVEGDSLEAMIAAGPLDVGRVVAIGVQICDGLAAAHRAGIVHRDVKPGNILVTSNGQVKVCDFGIASLQHVASGLTKPATVVGTGGYMAPEQAAGDPVDARADLYGLGCVLYAMLTGGPPFAGDSPLGVVWQHLNRPVDPVASRRAGVPAGLDALVGQLLAKHPADRPATAEQVRARLDSLPGQPVAAGGVASPGGRAGARASATVVSRTQTLPVLDRQYEPVPAARGRGLGPAGIVGVAMGAAVLAALATMAATLLLNGAGKQSQGGATETAVSSPAAPTATVPTGGPAELITAVQAAIEAQLRAGELDADTARDMVDALDEIARRLTKGEPDKAAEKVADLRGKLRDFRKDNKITEAGYAAVLASLNQLADTLPAPKGRNRDGDRNRNRDGD